MKLMCLPVRTGPHREIGVLVLYVDTMAKATIRRVK
jgi:hypothetical protein